MTGDEVVPDPARTVRLFVALPVPDHVRTLTLAASAPARERFASLTWTRPEGWHITLAFLGDVATDVGAAAEDVIAAAVAGTGPMELRLGAPGRFGHRALWLDVVDDPAGAIASLGGRIQRALVAAGVVVEERLVRPHVTLARGSRRDVVDDEVVGVLVPVDAGWEADEVHLVRSDRSDGPARYPSVATWPLVGA